MPETFVTACSFDKDSQKVVLTLNTSEKVSAFKQYEEDRINLNGIPRTSLKRM